MGFFSKLRKLALRLDCNECGGRGKPIDDTTVECKKCNMVWDGSAEIAQQIVLAKEKNTVVRAV